MQAINVRPYIGLPFSDHSRGEGFDCWGLVRLVYLQERGIELPDYGDRYVAARDATSVQIAIRDGLIEGWREVEAPQAWALSIFKVAGQPWHIGLAISPHRFLHMPAKKWSCVERFSSPEWANRIEGFYVYG